MRAAFLDCILRPGVGRNSNTTSINHILQTGHNVSQDFDSEIRSGASESSRLRTSREYLQQLLDGYQLSELYVPGDSLERSQRLICFSSKFKLPSGSGNSLDSHSTAAGVRAPNPSDLGPFARMMLDSTDVAFRCRVNFLCAFYA